MYLSTQWSIVVAGLLKFSWNLELQDFTTRLEKMFKILWKLAKKKARYWNTSHKNHGTYNEVSNHCNVIDNKLYWLLPFCGVCLWICGGEHADGQQFVLQMCLNLHHGEDSSVSPLVSVQNGQSRNCQKEIQTMQLNVQLLTGCINP